MLDIVDINLSHYRSSADLETGRHFLGFPQPVVTGATTETELYVGGTRAWVLPNDKAKAYYMEFLGQGLKALSDALKEKNDEMAVFSAMLQNRSVRGSEAEGTVRLRYSSDAASLVTVAQSSESILNKTYRIIASWYDPELTPEPEIVLNKDFLSDRLTYNELTALTKAWVEGGLSDDEYRYNLQRGEIIPPDGNTDITPGPRVDAGSENNTQNSNPANGEET